MKKFLTNDNNLTRITWPYVWWDGWFSEDELTNITQYCDSQGTNQVRGAVTEDGINTAGNIKARQHFLNDETSWFFDRLNGLVDAVNDRYYQMDLYGYDHFTFTHHEGAGVSNRNFRDLQFGESIPRDQHLTRKLTVMLMLSDRSEYEGGDLEIQENPADPILVNHKKGRLVAIPSYMTYGIRALLSGNRKTIDAYVLGPKFR